MAEVLDVVSKAVAPGVSAFELNAIAEREIAARGAAPSFKDYQPDYDSTPFPGALCVSVNDEVVHGLPQKTKVLRSGDIVSLDLGVWYRGLATDAALTVPVSKTDRSAYALIDTTKLCLEEALRQIKPGNTIGDIGHAIESTARTAGFTVVRELVGHGVGLAVHEDPEIPCYGKPGQGLKLQEGMVLAIEPMVNEGQAGIGFSDDGWTVQTSDGKRSAHFEHTLIVTDKGCEVLTVA